MNEIIRRVGAIIDEAAEMKKAYFWSAPTGAKERRFYEKRHSHPVVEWGEGGHHYTAAYTVTCSCRNIYAKGTYTRDGAITTLITIKNSLKRLQNK